MPAESGIIALLYQYVWLPLSVIIGYLFRDSREKNDSIKKLEERIAIVETQQISEQRIRTIIKESLGPFMEDRVELKKDVKAIAENVVQLRVDMAAQNATRGIQDGVRRE